MKKNVNSESLITLPITPTLLQVLKLMTVRKATYLNPIIIKHTFKPFQQTAEEEAITVT